MGTEPILPVKRSVSIDTMINFDGHGDGDGDGHSKCKQIFTCEQGFIYSRYEYGSVSQRGYKCKDGKLWLEMYKYISTYSSGNKKVRLDWKAPLDLSLTEFEGEPQVRLESTSGSVCN